MRGEGREAQGAGQPRRHRLSPRIPRSRRAPGAGRAGLGRAGGGAAETARARGRPRGPGPRPPALTLGFSSDMVARGGGRRRRGSRQRRSGRVTLSARRSPAATARGAALCPPNPCAPVGCREVTWRARVHEARALGGGCALDRARGSWWLEMRHGAGPRLAAGPTAGALRAREARRCAREGRALRAPRDPGGARDSEGVGVGGIQLQRPSGHQGAWGCK